ncbi:MAG: DUF1415 domain-containing protein, partial [Bacteroidota bacterium]
MSPVEKTEAWVRDFVLAHALCPFAARPYALGSVLTVALEGSDLEACFHGALTQVQTLLDEEPAMIETTLLVFPEALADFETFLDFLATFYDALEEVGADELVQLAHFHPDYHFDDTLPDDPGNRTNRSPYPVIQLLRSHSVADAIVAYPDIEKIPERNIAKMRELFG